MLAIGTGLGGFLSGYDKAKQAAQASQAREQALDDERRKKQAMQAAGVGLDAALGSSLPGGDALAMTGQQPAPPMPAPQQPSIPSGAFPAPAPQAAPSYAGSPQGSGMSSGLPAGSGRLRDMLERSQSALPPGYRAQITSADRPGARVAGTGGVSQHALDNAIDTQIVGPGGPIPNKGDDTTGLYQKLALAMRQNAGPMAPKLAWGGNFTTGPANGPRDLMHFDLGGDRGKFGTLAQLAQQVPPQVQQQGQQTAQAAQRTMPPELWGRSSLKAAADAIERANPGLDPGIKFMALMELQKVLAPDARQQMQLFLAENRNELQLALKDMQIQAANSRTQDTIAAGNARAGEAGWDFITKPDGSIVRANKRTGQVEPTTLEAGSGKMGSGAGKAANPQEVAYWAEVLKNGGHMPPGLARTSAGSKLVQEIMAKMAADGSLPQGMGPSDFIANVATVKADDRSLSNMTKMADAATSFERTASQNFDLALKLSKGAVPTDLGPFFNRWIEKGETQFGDLDVPPYVTAMLTGANEYAKIMSGSTGAQGSTVDSRREAAELFSPYLSAGQIDRVVAVAKADMGNRKQSLYGQIDDIKGRLRSAGGKGPTATQGQAPGQDPLPPSQTPMAPQQRQGQQHQEGETATNPQTGEKLIFRGGKWTPAGPPL